MNLQKINNWLVERIERLTKRQNVKAVHNLTDRKNLGLPAKEKVVPLTNKKPKSVKFMPSFIKSRLDRDFVFPGDVVAMTESGADAVSQRVYDDSGVELNGFERDKIIGTQGLVVFVNEDFENCTVKYEYRDPYGNKHKFHFKFNMVDATEGYTQVVKRTGDKYMKNLEMEIVKETRKEFKVKFKNPISGYKPIVLNLKKFWVKND